MIKIETDRTYLINKPIGWTSFDVVAKIRNLAKQQIGEKIKVGHTGTLDPFASGLLIILLGSATKNQADYMKLDKEYEATLFMGATSSTGDPEGEITFASKPNLSVTKAQINKTLKKFTGTIEQIPPSYSAIKVNGTPAYKLARLGKSVELKPRPVTIKKIEMLSYSWPIIDLKIACSSGTYIRSLAKDLGQELGCGAYLTALTRTKIGHFTLSKAKELTDFGTET